MTQFKGKAIYNPSGKAGEYSQWACNFYVGCSNGCEYCYCKKGILAGVMGQNAPQLKKCFRDEDHALEVFEREMVQNIDALREHGLFFTFTSDPMLPETIELTWAAVVQAVVRDVPVKILTKCASFSDNLSLAFFQKRDLVAFGFTLTGHDELEPHASTNAERVAAMRKLHDAGFKTFASIEPIVDLASSETMIEATLGFCDLYKIGLMSGKKDYDKEAVRMFVGRACYRINTAGAKVFWKESVRRFLGREIICAAGVDSDYNLFRKSPK